MRLIDADEFDRELAAAEFHAALNNADDEDRSFREQTMYYSTQSFRSVMSCRPTVDAIPVWRLEMVRDDADEAGDLEMRDAVTRLIDEWNGRNATCAKR